MKLDEMIIENKSKLNNRNYIYETYNIKLKINQSVIIIQFKIYKNSGNSKFVCRNALVLKLCSNRKS